VLNEDKAYHELGADYVVKAQEKKRKTYLKKELELLGYEVQIRKAAAG